MTETTMYIDSDDFSDPPPATLDPCAPPAKQRKFLWVANCWKKNLKENVRYDFDLQDGDEGVEEEVLAVAALSRASELKIFEGGWNATYCCLT